MVVSKHPKKIKEKNRDCVNSFREYLPKCGLVSSRAVSPSTSEPTGLHLNEKGHMVFEEPQVPYGLVLDINNYHKEHKTMTGIYFYKETEGDVKEGFDKMVSEVTGSGVVYRDRETGEVKEGKNKSRWNKEYNYGGAVYHRLYDEISRYKHVSMATLTLDLNLVVQLVPQWWTLSLKVFVILFMGKFVTNFEKQVAMYRRRLGLKKNYLGSVLEFHLKPGKNQYYLHAHVIFLGDFVAPLDKLHQFWGLSQYQGVDVRKISGKRAVNYISKYVSKNLELFRTDPEMKKLAIWFWRFRRRLYNVAHKTKDGKGCGISRRLYVKNSFDLIGYSYHGEIFPVNPERAAYKEKMAGLKKNDHWYEYEDDE